MMNNRDLFLHRPPSEVVDKWSEQELAPVKYSKAYEAECSTWIENEEFYETAAKALRRRRHDLSCDMLRDAHKILMKGNWRKFPGMWRPVNVRIGRYHPPIHEKVPDLMAELEEFIQDASVPPLLKAVWGHIQFETIHPFADGNGRIGRLLVNKILDRPFAPAVLEFRATYYALLDSGDWDDWRIWMTTILKFCPTMSKIETNPWA